MKDFAVTVLFSTLNTILPAGLIAEDTAMLPLLPVALIVGVFPFCLQFFHVLLSVFLLPSQPFLLPAFPVL